MKVLFWSNRWKVTDQLTDHESEKLEVKIKKMREDEKENGKKRKGEGKRDRKWGGGGE